LLVRREAYEQVGGLDPAYFFYNEESDWCYRFKKVGWQVWYVPQAELIHLGGQSSQRVPYHRIIWFYQGYLRFYRKFYSPRALLGHRMAVWGATLPKLLILLGLLLISKAEKRFHRLQLMKTYWKVLWLPAKI
jgi:GT2 family glycosyltransferase